MRKTLPFLALLASTFSFAQVTIGSGTLTDSNAGLSTPISIYYSTSLAQMIYMASEIGTAGTITSIDFKVNNTNSLVNTNGMIDVWIGHTTRSSYSPVVGTSGADWISIAGHSQVVANGTFTQTGTTITFTFSTPFAYNGTDNLVITIDANKPGDDGNTTLFYQIPATPNITSLMIRTDTAADNADPFNPPLNYTGGTIATSVQAKRTRPIIVLNGLVLGVEEHGLESAISLYPNPATNGLFVASQNKVASGEIYTMTGQLVRSVTIEENKIPIGDLSSGVYLLKLRMEDGQILDKKFVKQ